MKAITDKERNSLALVTLDEMHVIHTAIEDTIDNLRILIRSEHVVNPKFRTKQTERLEAARKESLQEYRRMLAKIQNTMGAL